MARWRADFLYETEYEAAQAAEFFRQHLRKKYHRRGEIRVVGGTIYWEDRKARTNLKAYPRADKRTGEPLVRIEWIFKRAAHIRERIGIATIGDFSDFDFDSFIAKHFLLEEINPVQVGRWINNIPRGAEVTVSPVASRITTPPEQVICSAASTISILLPSCASTSKKSREDSRRSETPHEGKRICLLTRYKLE